MFKQALKFLFLAEIINLLMACWSYANFACSGLWGWLSGHPEEAGCTETEFDMWTVQLGLTVVLTLLGMSGILPGTDWLWRKVAAPPPARFPLGPHSSPMDGTPASCSPGATIIVCAGMGMAGWQIMRIKVLKADKYRPYERRGISGELAKELKEVH
ncbi:hypothetical protein PAPYR_199 [Paratrimastix pyriformis]|uniref:Uncharacterized protein n=1 Tax=Paratrimastix pyriformis TaxID=342808 RepID=A0ABQ8UV41_9EUKA|nr:hypothetical protein PAPYR_199 [Paratrimastix pyriformis]